MAQYRSATEEEELKMQPELIQRERAQPADECAGLEHKLSELHIPDDLSVSVHSPLDNFPNHDYNYPPPLRRQPPPSFISSWNIAREMALRNYIEGELNRVFGRIWPFSVTTNHHQGMTQHVVTVQRPPYCKDQMHFVFARLSDMFRFKLIYKWIVNNLEGVQVLEIEEESLSVKSNINYLKY